MASSNAHKTVVIAGCDIPASYGYELALRLDFLGYSVFAGCSDNNSLGARALASRGSTNLAVIPLNVTKQNDINDAAEMIEESVGDEGVWALVNCAEHYSVAEVDWNSLEEYEYSIQVNLMGTIRVIKSLLHLIRRARGRIINLSSIAGCLARAGHSAFSASKFALEAFSDSLRQEMIKWGVFVILVQPAYFPAGNSILSKPDFPVYLQSVPQETREIYGEDYFVDFINSVSNTVSNELSTSRSGLGVEQLNKPSTSTNSSGYSSVSSSLKSSIIPDEKKQLLEAKDSGNTNGKSQKGTIFASLSRTTPALSNTNRVLHALVEASTSPSPKVRYFVGTFQDKVIKAMANIVPTVFMDTYLTSGQVSKVIPKLLKEKME